MKENEEMTRLAEWMERVALQLERARFAEYVQLLNRPARLLVLNFVSGIARGVGAGLGFTVIVAILLLILQELAVLNLPIIGKYIAEIVKMVQAQMHTPTVP
ncbi:DUF5665 domain-containing protein [Effusibacillus pohliae]|uniref:DUF5665 domain-containing protein n=1 Tax=Effusibacillus pohliae TaxID=232270 RepID=UPI0003620825|nr:DUF5665 domain-containing protein [Effusibacillus pohliae]